MTTTNPYAAQALAKRGPAPSGYHYEARSRDSWLVLGPIDQPRRCRANAGYHKPACGENAIVLMNRGGRDRPNWWAYCAEHMPGRWIEDGKVMCWVLVKDTVDGAA